MQACVVFLLVKYLCAIFMLNYCWNCYQIQSLKAKILWGLPKLHMLHILHLNNWTRAGGLLYIVLGKCRIRDHCSVFTQFGTSIIRNGNDCFIRVFEYKCSASVQQCSIRVCTLMKIKKVVIFFLVPARISFWTGHYRYSACAVLYIMLSRKLLSKLCWFFSVL